MTTNAPIILMNMMMGSLVVLTRISVEARVVPGFLK